MALPAKAPVGGVPAKEKQKDSQLLVELKEKYNKLKRKITIKKNILFVLEKNIRTTLRLLTILKKMKRKKRKN